MKNMRSIMYVNNLANLNFESYEEFISHLQNEIKSDDKIQFASILHDKDIDEDGLLVPPHVHVMLYKEDRFSMKYLKDLFKDKRQQNFEFMRDKTSGFLYLTHDTQSAKNDDKHVYDVSEVTANFDYAEYVMKSKTSNSKMLDNLFSMIVRGELTKRMIFEDEDMTNIYIRNKQLFEEAFRVAAEKQINNERDGSLSVIYIYSDKSGVGKTYLARKKAQEYIERTKSSLFKASASNDLFQGYSGEEVIILDDLRPSDVKKSEFLNVLDPHYIGSASSRYTNKIINAKLIIITSVYTPIDFATELLTYEPIDQFLRRLTIVYKVDKVEEDGNLACEVKAYRMKENNEYKVFSAMVNEQLHTFKHRYDLDYKNEKKH